MATRVSVGARAAAATPDGAKADAEALAVGQRHNYRARFWRAALGVLGLFWVCVLLLLMG